MSTSIGTTLLNPRALIVRFTAFDTGGGKAAGFLGSWAIPLLYRQDVLEELTAGQAFIVLLGEQRLGENRKKNSPVKDTWSLISKTSERQVKILTPSNSPLNCLQGKCTWFLSP